VRRGATAALAVLAVAPIGVVIAVGQVKSYLDSCEAATIDDLRTVRRAQAIYAEHNAGFFDGLECVGAPPTCLKSYPSDDPTGLEPSLASLETRSGYVRALFRGPAVPSNIIVEKGISATSIRSYAYVAVPSARLVQLATAFGVQPSGLHSFCTDGGEALWYRDDGTMPPPIDGRCPAEQCKPMARAQTSLRLASR
jgi:hypothetical protein